MLSSVCLCFGFQFIISCCFLRQIKIPEFYRLTFKTFWRLRAFCSWRDSSEMLVAVSSRRWEIHANLQPRLSHHVDGALERLPAVACTDAAGLPVRQLAGAWRTIGMYWYYTMWTVGPHSQRATEGWRIVDGRWTNRRWHASHIWPLRRASNDLAVSLYALYSIAFFHLPLASIGAA